MRGRLPGASAFGWPSSSTNISLRVLSVQPSSGANADFRKTPPLGVNAIMLPRPSIAAMCVVPSATAGAGAGVTALRGVPDGGAASIARSGAISDARSARYAGARSSASGTVGTSP